ncbi:putative uncharacterized protein DDB_G0285119 [Uranotaenia lowii]|uniref:putative uncharacterized protein DDB_G0285119 n=1 Tax=Uranotaenia lowii TaxID=190385 RepID=UPI00247AC939|nr:putative uncharacterized protein DDB_G0285119 [Uranotaenia lowii]
MAKDNNNVNIANELGDGTTGNGSGSSSAEVLKQNNSSRLTGLADENDSAGRSNGSTLSSVPSSSTERYNGSEASESSRSTAEPEAGTAFPELPRREENPFSFKHFLKRDTSLGGTTSSSSATATVVTSSNGGNINHSRSACNINGNNGCSFSGSIGSSTNNNNNNNSSNSANNNPAASGASPSKSATTSSLHNTSTTGAKPKIPQFQSVNTLSSESKMKRSPRFPSFDSQSSLSDLADDKFMANIYHSRSNSSFNSDYPLGSGGGTGSGSQYVQRSFSNYDMESPGSVDSPRLIGSQNLHNSPNFGGGSGRSRENLSSTHRLGTSEFSAALPDFVQDHLVMEQWYNTMGSPKSVSPVSVDFDQLPDFAVNDLDPEPSSGRGHIPVINDMPFDLTYNSATIGSNSGGSGSANRNRTPLRNTSPNVPLDLPPQNLDFSFGMPRRRTTPPQAIAELPPDLTDNNATATARSGYFFSDMDRNHSSPPSGSAADKIHRLPDFLSDGPIHSSGRLADVTQHDTPHFNSPDAEANHHHQQRLQIERQENDRLRRELEDNRRMLSEQARRIRELEKSLETARSNASLAQTVGGIEENLDKSYLRAATAESQVLKLRQKIKRLYAEIETLRSENEVLKEGGAVGGSDGGACGGGAPDSRGAGVSGFGAARLGPARPQRMFTRSQELSRELRQAAASAENNLRQLLTGVDNLRMMASTIENIDRIEISHPEDFLSDSDDDDLLGPAL